MLKTTLLTTQIKGFEWIPISLKVCRKIVLCVRRGKARRVCYICIHSTVPKNGMNDFKTVNVEATNGEKEADFIIQDSFCPFPR